MARAILARPVALLARKNGLSHFGTLIVTGFGTIARAFLARPVKCQRARAIRERQLHYLECQNGLPFWHRHAVALFACKSGYNL